MFNKTKQIERLTAELKCREHIADMLQGQLRAQQALIDRLLERLGLMEQTLQRIELRQKGGPERGE